MIASSVAPPFAFSMSITTAFFEFSRGAVVVFLAAALPGFVFTGAVFLAFAGLAALGALAGAAVVAALGAAFLAVVFLLLTAGFVATGSACAPAVAFVVVLVVSGVFVIVVVSFFGGESAAPHQSLFDRWKASGTIKGAVDFVSTPSSEIPKIPSTANCNVAECRRGRGSMARTSARSTFGGRVKARRYRRGR
jgi:hypothetical protein